MELALKGTRYEPTSEIEAQARKQVGGLSRFANGGEARAELELERAVGGTHKGDIWRAELMVITPTARYRAESTKAKLPHAITTVVRDVGREMSRAKQKEHRFFRKGSAAVKGILRGFGGG
jgi:ribosome-associated translation inhibitor RaiA